MKITVKAVISGFRRIGRLAFRQMFRAEGYEIVAINDLIPPKMPAHLLKYDSIQGTYIKAGIVVAGESFITVDGREITIYAEADAENLPWGKSGTDAILGYTGLYISKDKTSAHIEAGARKVVVSASAGNDLPTVVFNTNHDVLKPEDTVIPVTSYITNCLAPMAKVLNDLAPIQSNITSTIYAYVDGQMTLDEPQRKGDLYHSRTATVNIVPNSTGVVKAIDLVISELKDKPTGSVQRVPIPIGSTTVLAAVVKGKVTVDEVNTAMKITPNESSGYTADETVSSDIIGMRYGSLFDTARIMVIEMENGNTQVQVVFQYDSEDSCTSQMVRAIRFFSRLV